MGYAIQRNTDNQFFAGQVKVNEMTGFSWSDRENAKTYDDEAVAIAEARTILHAHLGVDLDVPGQIRTPEESEFDVEVVDLAAD